MIVVWLLLVAVMVGFVVDAHLDRYRDGVRVSRIERWMAGRTERPAAYAGRHRPAALRVTGPAGEA